MLPSQWEQPSVCSGLTTTEREGGGIVCQVATQPLSEGMVRGREGERVWQKLWQSCMVLWQYGSSGRFQGYSLRRSRGVVWVSEGPCVRTVFPHKHRWLFHSSKSNPSVASRHLATARCQNRQTALILSARLCRRSGVPILIRMFPKTTNWSTLCP